MFPIKIDEKIMIMHHNNKGNSSFIKYYPYLEYFFKFTNKKSIEILEENKTFFDECDTEDDENIDNIFIIGNIENIAYNIPI
jgi:hypothetical protein